MKKEDFKGIFNPVFMEKIDIIIGNGGECFRVKCGKCPFFYKNSSNNASCRIKGLKNPNSSKILLENAKAFKAMVEEEKEKLNFKEINNLTKEIIENTDKKLNGGNMEKEFKVGDEVININEKTSYYSKKGVVKEVYEDSCLVNYSGELVICHKSSLEKRENNPKNSITATITFHSKKALEAIGKVGEELKEIKEQVEPFELKEGMKVILKHRKEPIVVSYEKYNVTDSSKNFLEYAYNSKCCLTFFNKDVDWEATRKINENYGLKADFVFLDETDYPKENKQFPNEKESELKEEKVFGLKRGMKVKTNFKKELLYFYGFNTNTKHYACCSDINREPNHWLKENEINWEETGKLNEVKEDPKKETKPKEYMIFNPKGNAPRKIHNSLESAEKEVIRLLNIQSNQEFYILEIVKKAKGSITVSWSE